MQQADPAAWGLSRAGLWGAALGLSCVALVSAALGLWVGQLASAPSVHPPEVSGVGPHSANLGVGNWASSERRCCLSSIHRPGAEGGGVPEAAAAIFFSFLRNSSYSSPLVQTSTWLLTQLSPALSQESCSRPCALAWASALLSLSTLLTVRSFNVLYLWSLILSLIHISEPTRLSIPSRMPSSA